MPLTVSIVTAEREVYAEDGVDQVTAPGVEGEFTVLPEHAAMLTMINPGVIRIVKGGEEIDIAVAGGFFEIRDDRVSVLADFAERADDIDALRAEEARQRAERALEEKESTETLIEAAAALQRSLLRLRAVERTRRRRPGSRPPPGTVPPGS